MKNSAFLKILLKIFKFSNYTLSLTLTSVYPKYAFNICNVQVYKDHFDLHQYMQPDQE